VALYRKSGKNDGNDAEAICEAVSRPNMRFVPIKSVQQQADLSVHRVRLGFVAERTATLNRIRGLLAEFGFVLPNGAEQLPRQVPQFIDRLPAQVVRCVRDLLEHAERLRTKALEQRTEQIERDLTAADRRPSGVTASRQSDIYGRGRCLPYEPRACAEGGAARLGALRSQEHVKPSAASTVSSMPRHKSQITLRPAPIAGQEG
jgi:hypothetical protein